jgi:hypothetical protein
MGNMLRAFELEERELDPDDPSNEFLQACAFGIMSTLHTTLQVSPGQLVFGRDIFMMSGFNQTGIESKIINKKIFQALIKEKI